MQFVDPDAPARRFLLDAAQPWHSAEHAWGSGFLITDAGAARWNEPNSIEFSEDGVTSTFVTPEVGVRVDRSGGEKLVERYAFTNRGDQPVRLRSVGLQTPFADVYEDATTALTRSVHAHVFTGGTWAWVLAQPMDGAGRCLGLTVIEGALHAYSIESRNPNTMSNARGHIVLQPTDAARNPDAFGGQPTIELAPGETWTLAWEIAFHDRASDFLASTAAPADLSSAAVQTGEVIRVITNEALLAGPDILVEPCPGGYRVSSAVPGVHHVAFGGGGKTDILFHPPVEFVVRARAEYILRNQRATERSWPLGGAFLPIDTATLLTQTSNGWSDWSDGSERVGMALLLQLARRRGWAPDAAEAALEAWAEFARTVLVDAAGTPRRGSQDHTGARLYDSPWLARFFLERFRTHHRVKDLDTAELILRRAFELGVARFLAIGLGETCRSVADELHGIGRESEAEGLRSALVDSARHFLSVGDALPAHEVAYEQSIVAPLVSLFIDAYALTGDDAFAAGIKRTLPWLLAFVGPQPHARLNGVSIRHWDGYWFGLRRQWGDVFPHHWSVLTAAALLRLPEPIRSPTTDRIGMAGLHAGMSNFFPDGSATCAFIFPSTVDSAAAHAADPLANDQDWHLAIWLLLDEYAGVPLR